MESGLLPRRQVSPPGREDPCVRPILQLENELPASRLSPSTFYPCRLMGWLRWPKYLPALTFSLGALPVSSVIGMNSGRECNSSQVSHFLFCVHDSLLVVNPFECLLQAVGKYSCIFPYLSLRPVSFGWIEASCCCRCPYPNLMKTFPLVSLCSSCIYVCGELGNPWPCSDGSYNTVIG